LRDVQDKDGWLSLEEFMAALVRLNFVGVQRESAALFDRYDKDGSGFLSYEEFSAALFGLIPNPSGDAATRSAISRVRSKIAERGGLNGIHSIGRILRIME
jgi:calcyphosin